MSALVAGLYVDPAGPYFGRADVDPWDEKRDARLYAGPLPVVAHPPCGPWGALRHLYLGSAHDCGPRAVEQVRAFGGVLEHPARSLLWDYMGLPKPGAGELFGDDGFTVEIDQCAWGHVARKKTWLWFVGVARDAVLSTLRTGGTPTHWVSGFRSSTHGSPKRYKTNGCAVPPGIKVCSAQQRRRTPRALAEWLVSLAREAVSS